MIANTAFLAALTVFLLVGVAGRRADVPGAVQGCPVPTCTARSLSARSLLVFLNLCAFYYALARWLFLRDTGRKLTHVDRQLIASEGVHEDLPPHLWSTRG